MTARLSAFILFVFCVLSLAALNASYAQETTDNPLPTTLPDPVFLDIPNGGDISAESQSGIWVYLNYNYDRCREFYGDMYYTGCNRRLGLDGRRVDQGIEISPAIKGEWRWNGDYGLSFTPAETWQAGTTYIANFNLDEMGVPASVVFGPEKTRTFALNFQSKPLTVGIPKMTFMQDPDDPAKKLVTAQISLNYPVKPEVLKEHLKLQLEEANGGAIRDSKTKLDYEWQNETNMMSAQIAVPLKTLPDQDRYMKLSFTQGIAPRDGGNVSGQEFSERTRIPSLKTYLAISRASSVIAREADGTPRQLLSLELNTKASPSDILPAVKAWVLPAQHPVSKTADGAFYEWKASNEVSPQILKNSQELTLEKMPDQDTATTQLGFPVNAPANRFIYLTVDAGAKAFGGYTLERKFDAIVKVPAWPNDVKIMQEGSILTLSGSRKLSLHARGTDKLAIEVAHIQTGALQHFISQTEGDIRTPSFRYWSFGKEDIATIDTKEVPMNFKAAQISQYASFDFTDYLKGDKKGLFLLNIQGMREGKNVGDAQQRFVLVSDLGLLVKSGRTSRDVFLVSFETGEPVPSAKISVIARNGQIVFTGKTGSSGRLELPDLDKSVRDREPVAIIAEKNDDFTFIPYNRNDRQLNLSNFDVGGSVASEEGLNAFLFTDRGIYRPGETVQMAAIVRNADWEALPPELPLHLLITDPRGKTVKTITMNLTSEGLQDAMVETGEAWPTGRYTALLRISRDNNQTGVLGSTSFTVEDFQPDRLRIKSDIISAADKAPAGWAKADGLQAKVNLTNLYGTPASARRITTKVSLNPVYMSFGKFTNYTFYDSYPARQRAIEYDLAEAVTDAQGNTRIDLNLGNQPQATYELTTEIRGFEAGSGRGVTSFASTMISPMEYAIGSKTDAQLNYLKQDKEYKVHLIAVDPDLAALAVSDLTLNLIKIEQISSLVKKSDGSYAYESVPRETSLKSTPFDISSKGRDLSLPTKDLGAFRYEIKNKEGRVVSGISFSVAGEGESAGGKDLQAVLKIELNKPEYKAGEEIELHITAPYTGAGLITLESDRVLAHKWFKTKTTDTIQKIEIPSDFSGKGYVNISFVRDINSREIYLSPLSYAVEPFKANMEARTAAIDLKVPDKAKPGEPVTISYQGNIKGKAVIFAVDEGILQVADYTTPDPLDFFLLNRALQVRTAQMLDLLMPEYDLLKELSAKGGDDAGSSLSMGKHLNPFKRKGLAPAVYWSGIVDLDTDEKKVTFTPPAHFNGEMRVMAIAVSDEAVGSAEKPMVVRSDIILTPTTPLFMAPGDEGKASLTIANTIKGSGEKAEFALTATATGSLKLSGLPDKVTVPEGQEQSVSFTIKAGEEPGAASVNLTAALGDKTQSSLATLSVRPATPKETSLSAGYAEKGKASIAIKRDMIAAHSARSLSVSALPTAYTYGLLRYLEEFPYGCSEQTISKAMPQLTLANAPEFADREKSMQSSFDAALATLTMRQTPEGGFSLWDGDVTADDFVTVYALDFLIQAREAGQAVPSEMTEPGLRYLRNWINQGIKSRDDARRKAYGIYVLTRSGVVTTNEILHLLRYVSDNKWSEWDKDLGAVYIASAYRLMQQTDLAEKAISAFEAGLNAKEISYKARDYSHDYTPFIKYARAISLMARHFPERMEKLDRSIIFKLAGFIGEQNYTTLSSAYAIQSLQDYAHVAGATLAEAGVKLEVDGAPVSMNGDDILQAELTGSPKALEITGKGDPLFWNLSETGYDKAASAAAVSKNIEISRTYQTMDGKPLGASVAVGDIVDAVIHVRAHERPLENIAIVDLLPGGFEVDLNANLPAMSLSPDFTDRREDRIIVFTSVSTGEQTYIYRMRAVSAGTYVVPAAFAEAMYDVTTKARGKPGVITVTDKP